MNDEMIMQLADKAIKDSAITCAEFDILFSFMDDSEKARAEQVLHEHGIRFSDASGNEELCSRFAKGDQSVLTEICRKNERLVRKCAQMYYKYLHSDLDFEDLVQSGYTGLITAARHYNPSLGTRFSTYAVYWIKQSIRREAQECGHRVRLPIYVQESIADVSREYSRLSAGVCGEDGNLDELSAVTGLSVSKLNNLFRIREQFLCDVSLDSPLGNDNDSTLGSIIENTSVPSVEDEVESRLMKSMLASHIDKLTSREAYVINRRFGLNGTAVATLDQLGNELHITKERVRQLQTQALGKLRASMGARARMSA